MLLEERAGDWRRLAVGRRIPQPLVLWRPCTRVVLTAAWSYKHGDCMVFPIACGTWVKGKATYMERAKHEARVLEAAGPTWQEALWKQALRQVILAVVGSPVRGLSEAVRNGRRAGS